MRLTFHGAAGVVTGSAYQLHTELANVLVDFGMFQGKDEQNGIELAQPGFDPVALDAVLVTHAHLDHTGRLPLLAKTGYRGPVYATSATIPLASLILRDSAHLQQMDLERVNRRRKEAGEVPLEPAYRNEHVAQLIRQCQAAPYGQAVNVAPGITAHWVEAGHMLGSASIQLRVRDGSVARTLVFSGDIGPRGAPILEDAVGFQQADVVVMESTYGDRDNRSMTDTVAEFEAIVKDVVAQRAKIVVPVFAIGRAQLLLYLLARMFRHRLVPKFPIYLDTPMGIEATRIYWEHLELFDDEFRALQREHPLLEDLSTLRVTPTSDDSKRINAVRGPCLIMAGSGMCNGGRILHHLRHNLADADAHVLIVGYQGEGSLGRKLVDREPFVSIFGERIPVHASVHTLNGFSAHAGQTGLLRWLEPMAGGKPRIFLTHGEARGREPLASRIRERFEVLAELPEAGQIVEL